MENVKVFAARMREQKFLLTKKAAFEGSLFDWFGTGNYLTIIFLVVFWLPVNTV
jgi:hypothetical protein